MFSRQHFYRSSVIALGLLTVASGLMMAQGRRRLGEDIFGSQARGPREKLLVLPLAASNPNDSVFSVAVMDEVRKRIASKARSQITTIAKEQIAQALEQSGFYADQLFTAVTAAQLAEAMSAHAYTHGEVVGNSQQQFHIRVVDHSRSGAAGSFVISCDPGAGAKDCGMYIVDELERIMKSAEKVRECLDERDKDDYRDAVEKADEALREYAGNGSAYLCQATVYEVQNMTDSVISVLRRAVGVDSLNVSLWDRLFRQYQYKGDSLGQVEAQAGRLRAEPDNRELRNLVARMYNDLGQPDQSVAVIDEGLARDPTDDRMLGLKASICVEAGNWACILDALPRVVEIDPSRADTAYFAQLIGAAQQVADTQAQLRWAEAAVDVYPDRPEFQRALGDVQTAVGNSNGALEAYSNAFRLDSTDVQSALAVARARLEQQLADSTTWHILNDIAAELGNEQQQRAASLFMIQFTGSLVQTQQWAWAVESSERALALDPQSPARSNAAFFAGIAYFQVLNARYTEVGPENLTCELAAEFQGLLTTGQAYLEEGAQVNPNIANQFLGGFQQYGNILPRVREILECGS